MSGREPVSLLTPELQMGFAGLEGSLTWAVTELRSLAQADQQPEGLTPAEWAELADATEEWRASVTDLLDLIARHKAGGR